MAVDLAYEIWQELKRHISTVDRGDAADTLVSVLIDNDYDAADIRSAFKGDSDVKRSLESYLDDLGDNEVEEDDDYNDEEY